MACWQVNPSPLIPRIRKLTATISQGVILPAIHSGTSKAVYPLVHGAFFNPIPKSPILTSKYLVCFRLEPVLSSKVAS